MGNWKGAYCRGAVRRIMDLTFSATFSALSFVHRLAAAAASAAYPNVDVPNLLRSRNKKLKRL